MAWLFKFLGLIIIFTVSALTGFLKSMSLKKRKKKLDGIYRSMSDLRDRIRVSSTEMGRLINLCFPGDTACFTYGGIRLNTDNLEKSDISIIEEFFSDIGMSDAESECERTGLYIELVKKKCDEAEQKCKELCRLYNTLGVLCGIFICIFFI